MAKAVDVARYLVHRAAAEEETEILTHLRLQKLLYYVQGWSLALRNEPMFKERIEAWAHGPVVRDVFPYFADYKYDGIPPDSIRKAQGLTKDETKFIGRVWEAYKDFSAVSLREMTHKETPWKKARGGCADGEKCEAEITRASMKAFFRKGTTKG